MCKIIIANGSDLLNNWGVTQVTYETKNCSKYFKYFLISTLNYLAWRYDGFYIYIHMCLPIHLKICGARTYIENNPKQHLTSKLFPIPEYARV